MAKLAVNPTALGKFSNGFDTNWSFTKTKIKSNAQIFNNEDEFVKDHANAFGNSDFIRIYD